MVLESQNSKIGLNLDMMMTTDTGTTLNIEKIIMMEPLIMIQSAKKQTPKLHVESLQLQMTLLLKVNILRWSGKKYSNSRMIQAQCLIMGFTQELEIMLFSDPVGFAFLRTTAISKALTGAE